MEDSTIDLVLNSSLKVNLPEGNIGYSNSSKPTNSLGNFLTHQLGGWFGVWHIFGNGRDSNIRVIKYSNKE